MGSLTDLKWLGIGGVSGEIPAELANLTKLKHLRLRSARLTGPIPAEFGNLSNLYFLSVGDQLTGEIPPELGNLRRLEELILGSNQLSGSLPPELGSLNRLALLTLDDNQLSGSSPPEMADMARLGLLVLRGNNLSGEIPKEFDGSVCLWCTPHSPFARVLSAICGMGWDSPCPLWRSFRTGDCRKLPLSYAAGGLFVRHYPLACPLPYPHF